VACESVPRNMMFEINFSLVVSSLVPPIPSFPPSHHFHSRSFHPSTTGKKYQDVRSTQVRPATMTTTTSVCPSSPTAAAVPTLAGIFSCSCWLPSRSHSGHALWHAIALPVRASLRVRTCSPFLGWYFFFFPFLCFFSLWPFADAIQCDVSRATVQLSCLGRPVRQLHEQLPAQGNPVPMLATDCHQ
jgi:sterol desaturase/sphingolipid hydroxylase (fatty acid hydroxylase superfamily)